MPISSRCSLKVPRLHHGLSASPPSQVLAHSTLLYVPHKTTSPRHAHGRIHYCHEVVRGQYAPTAIGWLSHCSIQSKRSSSFKYNTKLYFLSTHILEYIISSTDSLNEFVNSNDNHVHTIIVELCEPLGLS